MEEKNTCQRSVGQDPPLWYDQGLQNKDIRVSIITTYRHTSCETDSALLKCEWSDVEMED